MSEVTETKDVPVYGRRDFLKMAGLTGGALFAASALGPDVVKAEAKTYKDIYEMYNYDLKVFKRFDAAHSAFGIQFSVGDNPIPGAPHPKVLNQDLVDQLSGKNTETPFKKGDPGFTQLDYAFCDGANTMQTFTGAVLTAGARHEAAAVNFRNEKGKLIPINLYGQTTESFPGGTPHCFDKAEEKFVFETPADASYAIKKAAKVYGADLVGIAPYDENFVYKTEPYMPRDSKFSIMRDEVDFYKPVDFGFEPKSVIVIALELDYECMKAQATAIEMAATTEKYSKMAAVSLSLANFIRKLGYNTCHAGNGKSPSTAEAIRAGLGESSRMTLLITEEYGPRVRLCKVYTDLECEYDKPKSFGVMDFCEVCQLCSDACPSEAISKFALRDPENKPVDECNQPGVEKWYLDSQACLYNWFEYIGGNDCGICISVCPYNKPQSWNHDLVKVITRVPGLNSLAKYFDQFFGYGGISDKQTIADFWKRTI